MLFGKGDVAIRGWSAMIGSDVTGKVVAGVEVMTRYVGRVNDGDKAISEAIGTVDVMD